MIYTESVPMPREPALLPLLAEEEKKDRRGDGKRKIPTTKKSFDEKRFSQAMVVDKRATPLS